MLIYLQVHLLCPIRVEFLFTYKDTTCLRTSVSKVFFFFSSRRRHTRCLSDWSSDVCSSDLALHLAGFREGRDALGVEARGIDVHSRARLHGVDDDEADDQRNRAHDLEVEQ